MTIAVGRRITDAILATGTGEATPTAVLSLAQAFEALDRQARELRIERDAMMLAAYIGGANDANDGIKCKRATFEVWRNQFREGGQPGRDNPGHAHAVGGGHVRSGESPATGYVAEPQAGPDGSSAPTTRPLTFTREELTVIACAIDEHKHKILSLLGVANLRCHVSVLEKIKKACQ